MDPPSSMDSIRISSPLFLKGKEEILFGSLAIALIPCRNDKTFGVRMFPPFVCSTSHRTVKRLDLHPKLGLEAVLKKKQAYYC